jgi:hypothetical protein
MTKLLFFLVVILAIAALIARSPRAKGVLWATFVLLAIYAILKATGVIEALAPARDGVF